MSCWTVVITLIMSCSFTLSSDGCKWRFLLSLGQWSHWSFIWWVVTETKEMASPGSPCTRRNCSRPVRSGVIFFWGGWNGLIRLPRGTTREQRKASKSPYLCSKIWRKNSPPTQGGRSARRMDFPGAEVWGSCLLASNTSSILLRSSEFAKMCLSQMYAQSSPKTDKANSTNACVPNSKGRHDSNYYSPTAIAVFVRGNIITHGFLQSFCSRHVLHKLHHFREIHL